jgi:hypothetical protein
MIQINVLEFLVQKGPGRTEVELARAIHGPSGYQQQVNQDLGMLVRANKVECRGQGGPGAPRRYYPIH